MGWIHNFIPPLEMDYRFLYTVGATNQMVGFSTMPNSISTCPVKWIYLGAKYDYLFTTSLNTFSITEYIDQRCPCITPQNRICLQNTSLFPLK
jgi:hypothetical protein